MSPSHLLRLFVCLCSLTATRALFGPPKLQTEPPEEVWFQPGGDEVSSNFVLPCTATDNVDRYEWRKNESPLVVDGGEIAWQREGLSGSLVFTQPGPHHSGYYQCLVSNIFGTALSKRVHVQLGVLEHFPRRDIREVSVEEGEPLSLQCTPPFGQPPPQLFWLYRDTKQASVIETIRRSHIVADGQGGLHFTSVHAHDGRPTLLYECAATSPVLHGEYRSGDRIRIRVKERSTPLAMVPPRALFLSSSNVDVKAGGRVKLLCIIGGFPEPIVRWSRKGKGLVSDRMKESDEGKSFVIDNVHPEDAGVYSCTAGEIEHSITVSVEAAPFWEKPPPGDISLAEGETAELLCAAGGSPAPLVTWSINGKALHEAADVSARHLFLMGGRLLQISSVNHDLDTAVYQCNASNPRGYVYANAFVHVKAHAPRFTMPAHRVWRVLLRSTVHINCDVDAAPAAEIRWVDASDRPLHPVPGKSEITAENMFKIVDVNTADEGLYYCNVSNKYGINRATNILQVYKPTYFVKVPAPKKIWVEAGQRVELECEAVADERLTITYNWTLSERPLSHTKGFLLEGTRLSLPFARGWHSGRIECAAVTPVDTKVAAIDLVVKDVPLWPPIESISCRERKATIAWNRPADNADPIVKYVVEQHTDFRKGQWKAIDEVLNVSLDSYEMEFNLSPWVNYTFRVAALNSHGRSEELTSTGEEWKGAEGDHGRGTSSGGRATCHTRPSFPYTNPSGVWAEGVAPDNLVVHWTRMEKVDWNAPQLQYLVRFRPFGQRLTAWTEILIEDSYANETPVREVPTFRKFQVQVRAVNAKGPSILEPTTVIGYSGEDTPESAPTDFLLETIYNFTSVNFSWSPVSAASLRGHPKGYEIVVWERERTRSSSRRVVRVASTTASHAVVDGLRSCTNYSAVIRARNKKYSSADSQVVHFTTPEGVPSRVSELFVRAVGARSLLVSWSPPLQPNGALRGYFLTFTGENNVTEETYVLHRQLHYLHEECEPETGYKVAVWAETGAGEGPKLLRVTRTWPARVPDEPRFSLLNSSETSADVEWTPSAGPVWRMPGTSFYINYTIDGRSFRQSAPTTLPSVRVHLVGLLPGVSYQLFGVAKDGSQLRQSATPLLLLTPSNEPPSHLSQDSMRSAFWFLAVLVAVAIALFAVVVTCCCERRRSGGYAVRRKEMEIGHQVDADEERRFLEFQYGYKHIDKR